MVRQPAHVTMKRRREENEESGADEERTPSVDGDDGDDSDSVSSSSDVKAVNQTKRKVKRVDDPASFSNAMQKILSSHLKAGDRNAPILSRSRGPERALDDAKLEAKAKRLLRQEKKQMEETGRVKNVLDDQEDVGASIALEKVLRKTAQRGVVRLFNAVRESQTRSEQAGQDERVQAMFGGEARKEKVAELSTEGFLDLIKSS